MGCDSIQQCNYINICFWGENKVFQEIIFLNQPHISIASTEKCMRYIVVPCLIFHQRLRGRRLAPPQPVCTAWWGSVAEKAKTSLASPNSPSLPPASAYITVWTPVQVESVRLDLARRYLLQSLSEGTPQGQPVWGWMKIKEWGELCSVLRRRVSLKVLNRQHSCIIEV